MPCDLAINDWPLPYETRLAARAANDIDLVVIHCTELPDLATAREFGERTPYASGTGNSGHFYIDRDGRVHRFVAPQRVAHHTRGYNERSIGIELVNAGRYPDWFDSRHQQMAEPYSEAQIASVIALLGCLSQEFPALTRIAGHEDLDLDEIPASNDAALRIKRKLDPGPLFPWPRVLEAVSLQREFRPASIPASDP